MELGLAILRITVGLVLAAHGSQKVFGWFGGHGMDGTRGMHEKLGMRPASLWAWINAGIEFFGGLLFALGVLTPLMAAAIIVNLLMAILLVHWEHGFFNMNGGYEFPLTLAIGALSIGLGGPGRYALGPQGLAGLEATSIFVGALLIGIVLLGVGLATRHTAPAQEPQTGD